MLTTTRHVPTPGWKLVGRQELSELWAGSKGLGVLFGYSLLLAILSYLAAADAGINLLDARESVGLITETAVALGALSAMIVAADSISGERERGTLEALLVTPLLRRHLVTGKLLAATTMWVAALAVALPFVLVLSRGPGVAVDAILVLLVVGSLVAISLTALGLAISALAMSNRASLAASVALVIVLAAPSKLPAVTANGVLGAILIRLNPISAGLKFTSEVLVAQQSWSSQWSLLLSPAIAAVALSALAVRLSRRIELGDSR